MKVEVQADAEHAAAYAAARMAEHIHAAVEARGRAAIAVSGGRTPAAMLSALGREPLPWDKVHVFQVDERVAALGDAARNLTMLLEALLPGGIARANIHAMPVEDPESSATGAYAGLLASLTGTPARLDAVHLGLGDDGHTASLVPGDTAALGATEDVVWTKPYMGHRRMTLTFAIINRARSRLWLVSGRRKCHALERLLRADSTLVASRVERANSLVVADRAAHPVGLNGGKCS